MRYTNFITITIKQNDMTAKDKAKELVDGFKYRTEIYKQHLMHEKVCEIYKFYYDNHKAKK